MHKLVKDFAMSLGMSEDAYNLMGNVFDAEITITNHIMKGGMSTSGIKLGVSAEK